jgi:hypothetical protein
MEEAATPFPKEETTPPVTKIYFGAIRAVRGFNRELICPPQECRTRNYGCNASNCQLRMTDTKKSKIDTLRVLRLKISRACQSARRSCAPLTTAERLDRWSYPIAVSVLNTFISEPICPRALFRHTTIPFWKFATVAAGSPSLTWNFFAT